MPLFGAHLSIAGAFANAVQAAVALGCETLQIFTKSPNMWAAKPLKEEEVAAFRAAVRDAKLKFVTAHDSYLINLAAADEALSKKSLDAFTEEVNRAEALGLDYLVMHPGAHMGRGEEFGLSRVAAALDEVHHRCRGYHVTILLETTAGQGTYLGGRFEHIGSLVDRVKESKRVGVCLDTCHVFAAGYPLGTPADYAATIAEFDDVVGLDRLKLFHVNDSEGAFCSCVDRHAHIGNGKIGLNAFRLLVNDPRFAKHPMILETPKEGDNGQEMDAVNLATLRGLVRKRRRSEERG